MTQYPTTPLVAGLPATVPFVGPETQERQRGRPFRARIGANESVFGPSPKAIQAMAEAARNVWMYGDPEVHELREAIARHHGVGQANIMVGEGIDGLFGYTVRMLVEPGVKVATSLGAYPTFNFHVAGFGGQLVTTPYVGDREDPGALLDLTRREGARVLFLANPDNPMGTWSTAATVGELIAGVPEGSILCLDEAYGEFAPEGTLPKIDVDNPRVLRFRTFSKAHGLAGLRVGYVIGEAGLINQYNKIRNHFGVGRIAQAGAMAALADQAHLGRVVADVAKARRRIAEIAAANGLASLPSATNFVAVDCGRNGDFARAVLKGLITRDVFVRMPGVAPLDRCIRVSAGTPAQLELLAEALPQALAEATRSVA
ncbi:MAG: pyridoxal phosphate-dependent aminotransferase [Rhizobiales bacterium]|nr:pyridoxal phosphate-dependent aminotransferase [Hyphomicrobiales bacterium]